MPSFNIVKSIPIKRTPRVLQIEGIFDISPSEQSSERWSSSFELPESWNVGLIVGPSGSGKTVIARHLFRDCFFSSWDWAKDNSIVDAFPAEMSIKDITKLLSSVGFSSPPSWLRPYHVLSKGEQFRVDIARTLAENPVLAVVDEFTSVVDRTVAKIGSAAIQKTVRRRNQKFIAVSCHYDIAEWLEPDWIYEPHIDKFHNGRYLQRPKIEITIRKVHRGYWQMFRKYHYLNTNLHKGAVCFVAFWGEIPVAFTAILHFPHATIKNVKREHRTVCLPDFQGVGIGNALSDYIGKLCRANGFRFQSSTSHPAMIKSRNKSENWEMIRKPGLTNGKTGIIARKGWSGVANRLTASFEYVGPALSHNEAIKIWNASVKHH